MTANGASLMQALFAGIVFVALGMLAVRGFPVPFAGLLVSVGSFVLVGLVVTILYLHVVKSVPLPVAGSD
ncbi:hypothetical protein GRX03_08285 [Halovenus sp. WSH3]|uniref:Uncharacterized protein n=1 Tax=Halovenus carboxidivorans TaxID=2692199 RepID=A0A6B0TEG8_9EURY|nr:hypothetical protein [Halovenus carboxidivorans]MXR51599.1 hypothetical protein [Halovenus carboxidivorans]